MSSYGLELKYTHNIYSQFNTSAKISSDDYDDILISSLELHSFYLQGMSSHLIDILGNTLHLYSTILCSHSP